MNTGHTALVAMIDSLVAERDRLRDALQALYDTCDATPGTGAFEEYQLALLRAESELQEGGL